MSVTSALSPEEVARVYREAYSNVTFTLALANSPGNLTAASSLDQWLANELDLDGYARLQVTPSETGSLESTTARFNGTAMTFQVTAGSSPLAWNAALLLVGGGANSLVIRTAMTNVVVADNLINYTPSSGLASFQNGDPVVVSAGDGGTLPGGLVKGTRYYVGALNPSQVRLYADAARQTPITLTSQGAGVLRIRAVGGSLHSVHLEVPTVVLAAGTSKTYRLSPYLNA